MYEHTRKHAHKLGYLAKLVTMDDSSHAFLLLHYKWDPVKAYTITTWGFTDSKEIWVTKMGGNTSQRKMLLQGCQSLLFELFLLIQAGFVLCVRLPSNTTQDHFTENTLDINFLDKQGYCQIILVYGTRRKVTEKHGRFKMHIKATSAPSPKSFPCLRWTLSVTDFCINR